MCFPRRLILVLGPLIVLGHAGCAQDSAVRTGPRSVASVGNKTEVVVSGESGDSIASTVPDYPADSPRDGKISGRVVDDHGRPVPNAKVRLAIAGAKGGRAESVKADSSGAFSLHRLKPGASYVVIAEAVDGDESLSGRATAKAPQTGLKIKVLPKDEGSDHFRTSSSTSHAKIGTVSNIEEHDEEDQDEPRRRPSARLNSEDLDPPAPEAESLRPRGDSSQIDIPDDDPEGREVRKPTKIRGQKKPGISASLHPERNEKAGTSRASEDDGENPLPPAIGSDADEASSLKSPVPGPSIVLKRSPDVESGAPIANPRPRMARGGTADDRTQLVRENRIADPEVIVASASVPAAELDADGEGRDEILLDKRPVSPFQTPHFNQVERPDTLFRTPQFGSKPRPVQLLEEAGSVLPVSQAGNGQTVVGSKPGSVPAEIPDPPKRLKWGDLAQDQVVPLDESLRKRPAIRPRKDSPSKSLASASVPVTRAGGGKRSGKTSPPVADLSTASTCRYDAAGRRLIDFRLPDLDGRMVSFKDFDSDLILLDFWGTWCAPCKTAIPQLIEFQRRFGTTRLQVVGIACERAPEAERPALVGKVRKELAINYPLLLTGKDGTSDSDLAYAMQVQFYPTMVLLNRQGQVLWRAQEGATGTTFARLERAIVSALK